MHTVRLCNTELVIWAAFCHIQYDFPLEIGISDVLLHHLDIRLGVHVTLQDMQCCRKLLHLVHEISAFTAVDMGMHDQVVSCHPLVWIRSQPAMSERGIWYATQIESQRKEPTRPRQQETEGLCVNLVQQRHLPHAVARRSSSRLCGGGGMEGAEGGEGVCL